MRRSNILRLVAMVAVPMAGVGLGQITASASGLFISGFSHVTTLGSTVPRNGDVNPYGMAVVHQSQGRLVAGDVLVSNFNNSTNAQGTGTTIVQMTPDGGRSVFAHITSRDVHGMCTGGVGLTTALAILHNRWVVVGSLPTSDGTSATAKAGCLIILDWNGKVVKTLNDAFGINGPWDLAAVDRGADSDVFVTNVLNGTVAANGAVVNRGTVVRLVLHTAGSAAPWVVSSTVIGSGFAERTDPAALVVGPTGVALSATGTLYVADTADNRIAAIPNALTRMSTAFTGADVTANGLLNAPLGLTLAPNGDILTVNAGDGRIVETTPAGAQVAFAWLDMSSSPPGSGALFGLVVAPRDNGVYFVDDATNTFELLH
ncbi:MAG TPA: hypothetical protein VNU19_12040 [Candidatus Acidoferrum sp.]|nr:hypothetical protein [Candidatus Acidoferrum sp.]